MDKEIEIQEMAKVLCGDKSKHLSSCKYCGETSCYFITNTELLYNAGYRKADEVRKETAKEILQELYDQTFERKDPYSDSDKAKEIIDRAEILHTAKMYGVEIDE
ncbi:MAG: hypothetical protein LUD27_01830 [Clostridia bacterium]|nr:hypothetical protein [Clostridia bacterium]